MTRVYTLGEFGAIGDDLRGHVVYVVTHPEHGVLYVGKTKDVRQRMYLHRVNRSPLGRQINIARKAADDWTITIYSLEDCAEVVRKHMPHEIEWYERNVSEGHSLDSHLTDAERSMIAELDPALNAQWW